MLRSTLWIAAAALYGVALFALVHVGMGADLSHLGLAGAGFLGGTLIALAGNLLDRDNDADIDHDCSRARPS